MKSLNICLVIGLLFLIACRENTTFQPEKVAYEYTIPEDRNDGWTTGSLQEVGLNTARISQMIDFFEGLNNPNIHGIAIVKDNKLVLEEYFKGYRYVLDNVPSEDDLIQFGPDTLHYLADISKIIIPLLYDIAREDGFVFDLDETVKDNLPEYSSIISDGKENIKLVDLISMTSGIEWNEFLFEYDRNQNDIQLLLNSDDPIKYFFEKNLASIPGSNFKYNSGSTIVLSEILERITGSEFSQYAENKLFTPLGINKVKWDYGKANMVNSSGGLYLTLRDIAKLGGLFASDGSWKGRSIISQEWINYSKSPIVELNYFFFANGYGPHVWTYNFETNQNIYTTIFWAGWGEQYLFVIPEFNLVFAVACGYFYDLVEFSMHSIVERYLLEALEN